MKTKSLKRKKQAFTFSTLLYRTAGFFLLLVAISNVVFNILSLMQVSYRYGFGLASTSSLFMYFHEVLANTSLRLSLVVIISFFFSSVLTFVSTEMSRGKLKYLIGGFIAYIIDFIFLIIPFPYQLSILELEFSFIVHTTVLSVLFIVILLLFFVRHLENVKAGKVNRKKEESIT